MTKFRQSDAGYALLLSRYGLDPDRIWRRSAIRNDTRPRETHFEGKQLVETFPRSYHRGDDDYDHLVFALRYEGVEPYALAQVFARTDLDALARRIAAQPTSRYARRLFFLCERLTQRRLELPDASLGAWCPALDPALCFTAAGVRSHRHRVLDNLLGDHEFCPSVRWTPALAQAISKGLDGRAAAIARSVTPSMLERATRYLYTKETKSSFAIEREQPGDRMERYIEQLATIGQLPLDTLLGLVELQNTLVHPSYAERSVRSQDEPEVYVGQTIGFREHVHHIGAPSALTPELMNGWLRMREVVEMPDKKEQLFINLCRHNGGTLSKRKRPR